MTYCCLNALVRHGELYASSSLPNTQFTCKCEQANGILHLSVGEVYYEFYIDKYGKEISLFYI